MADAKERESKEKEPKSLRKRWANWSSGEEIGVRRRHLGEVFGIVRRGVSLAGFCHKKLEEAQKRIEVATKGPDGKLVLAPSTRITSGTLSQRESGRESAGETSKTVELPGIPGASAIESALAPGAAWRFRPSRCSASRYAIQPVRGR